MPKFQLAHRGAGDWQSAQASTKGQGLSERQGLETEDTDCFQVGPIIPSVSVSDDLQRPWLLWT
jgi:hypothetical protein